MRQEEMTVKIPNKPEYITMIRLIASCFALKHGARVNTVEEFKLAVAEACNHMIEETDNEEIVITFCLRNNCLRCTFKDYGKQVEQKRSQIEKEISDTFLHSFMDSISCGRNLVMEKVLH
jgi:serine/threonine-protein kinase RsbW